MSVNRKGLLSNLIQRDFRKSASISICGILLLKSEYQDNDGIKTDITSFITVFLYLIGISLYFVIKIMSFGLEGWS